MQTLHKVHLKIGYRKSVLSKYEVFAPGCDGGGLLIILLIFTSQLKYGFHPFYLSLLLKGLKKFRKKEHK